MSSGYGGAKRMLWFIAKYANGVSEKKHLGIRFQAIVPQRWPSPKPTRTPLA